MQHKPLMNTAPTSPAIDSVCIYCGSSPGTSRVYADAATATGRHLAEAGVRLVYGGGSIGLMGIVARTVLKHGGKVTGVIPRFLAEREIMLKDVDNLLVTADMHERKRIMFDRSDAFAALPGGIGTLEEVVEMMTWAQLGQHRKPVVLINVGGFWDPLMELLNHMTQEGFLRGGVSAYCRVIDDPALLLSTIAAAQEDIARTPGEAVAKTEQL